MRIPTQVGLVPVAKEPAFATFPHNRGVDTPAGLADITIHNKNVIRN